jgi:hypothetical protein
MKPVDGFTFSECVRYRDAKPQLTFGYRLLARAAFRTCAGRGFNVVRHGFS